MSEIVFTIWAGQGGCGVAEISAGYAPGGMVWAGCVHITVESGTNLPADDAEALGQALISAAKVPRDLR